MVVKRPASAAADAPQAKRSKKAEGLYERFKGKSIPEPRLATLKVKGNCCKAIAWNVGGLRAVLAKRPQVLQKLVRSEKPAVFAFMEHKLQEGQHVEEATKTLGSLLPEYTSVRFACSKVKLGYSGVAVMLHKDVAQKAKVTPVKLEKGADEGRTVCVELPKLFVVVCYVMNSGDGLKRHKERLQQFDPKLRSYLQGLAKKETRAASWGSERCPWRCRHLEPGGSSRAQVSFHNSRGARELWEVAASWLRGLFPAHASRGQGRLHILVHTRWQPEA